MNRPDKYQSIHYIKATIKTSEGIMIYHVHSFSEEADDDLFNHLKLGKPLGNTAKAEITKIKKKSGLDSIFIVNVTQSPKRFTFTAYEEDPKGQYMNAVVF